MKNVLLAGIAGLALGATGATGATGALARRWTRTRPRAAR